MTSGTPLIKKLGFKPGMTVYTIAVPVDYADWLGELPEATRVSARCKPPYAAVHVFGTVRVDLQKQLSVLRQQLQPDGFVWVSWPKRSAHVATDITEDVIRELALPLGFVDIKVCAVTDVWSGLKLVIRTSERQR